MLGELSPDQIDRLLRSEVIGRIGCHAEGCTYVVPVTYVYDGQCIYGHTRDGLKVRLMRQNPSVCFEVDHVTNLANWKSVIARGTFEELHGPDAVTAMDQLIARLMSIMRSETSVPPQAFDTSSSRRLETGATEAIVYRIVLTEKTGRFETNEPEGGS